jgi:hypothetical protein
VSDATIYSINYNPTVINYAPRKQLCTGITREDDYDNRNMFIVLVIPTIAVRTNVIPATAARTYVIPTTAVKTNDITAKLVRKMSYQQ